MLFEPLRPWRGPDHPTPLPISQESINPRTRHRDKKKTHLQASADSLRWLSESRIPASLPSQLWHETEWLSACYESPVLGQHNLVLCV